MHLDREACYRALLTRDVRFDGQFYTAVLTTGIYCRPICPARPPRLENIVFMPSAAAAQAAGFRACLRCRPEVSPDVAAWRGTSSTVSRAMALIAEGALNDDAVNGLAGRLGMGERQLRRLFQKHIGASPKAVAQTRRILFAKQLITETSLSMTEVAMAAGFGSLRRFNDMFRAAYGRPPLSLRRAGSADVTASALNLTLAYKPPYDWPAMIGFLGARAIPGVEHVESDCYARSIALGGAHGTLTVRPAPRQSSVVVTIRFPLVSALPAIVQRVRQTFDLGADPAIIDAHLAEDPDLAPLVAARPGLRMPGAWDGFELAVRSLLGHQITLGGANTLAGRLVAQCGSTLPAAEDPALARLTHVFPQPEQVVAVENLGEVIGVTGDRVAAITALAAAAVANPRLFAAGASLEEAVDRLRTLPGIGEWTAQYIAMRALNETDAFPAADAVLLRAMATAQRRPTPADLLSRAAAWRPWRAYAAQHLWAADPAVLPGAPEAGPHRRYASVSRTCSVSDQHEPARL